MNNEFKELYHIKSAPKAKKEAMVVGERYRFTVLTSRLLRMEFSESGIFEDRATQIVLNRAFETADFEVKDTARQLEITTDYFRLQYNKKPFSREGLSIQVGKNSWHYLDQTDNLGGTARTLDEVDGAVTLENGLLSRQGFSVIDDSNSYILLENGWIAAREENSTDMYFLAYGNDYLGCLKDFYKLSGETPMLPRFTLGNWWSRFYEYTEESYMDLMRKFKEKKIPFSVAVIDMNWHVTRIDEKYGSGWTGYTWDKNFFPNPERFLKKLHQNGMHVTLNVHPADGIRAHEDMYPQMAKEMGVDYEHEEAVAFDFTNPHYIEAYFKYVNHPYEKMGVDFWWIDWQQGTNSRLKGLDPLWMLNHFHFLDSKREGKRPLTFSRYAGIGSHRYPIGFSGDTITTWESLDFQPYFTANASNVGYGWWSHDIGGHQRGIRDDEMTVRWFQFGVFSPIMRIHSTSNNFYGKEPWNYNEIAERVMTDFLRLRHRLVPYLYTMNYLFHSEGEPLIQPMYYRHSDCQESYEVPNEYYFGSQMIVFPITKPMSRRLAMAGFDAWIPEGTYFDFFTGRAYTGGRRLKLFRDINSIPVLVKAGSILPLTGEENVTNALCNPNIVEVRVYAGADGTFMMYEDENGNTDMGEGKCAKTYFAFQWGQDCVFTMKQKVEKLGIIPDNRQYIFRFIGVENPERVSVFCGKNQSFQTEYDEKNREFTVIPESVIRGEKLTVSFKLSEAKIALREKKQDFFALLHRAQIEYNLKEEIYQAVCNQENLPEEADAEVKDAIGEIMESK